MFNNVCHYIVHSLDNVDKHIVDPGRPQTALWHMRIACCVPKATNTHIQYILLIAFPLQPWLYKRASMLRSSKLAVMFTNNPKGESIYSE
jgi:hypothetical protein